MGNTDGDGGRASGDSGIWPHDLRLGDLDGWTSLCLRPCSVLGLVKWEECVKLAGELGTLEPGELLCDEYPGDESEGERSLLLLQGDRGNRPLLHAVNTCRLADDGVDEDEVGVQFDTSGEIAPDPVASFTVGVDRGEGHVGGEALDWKLRLGVSAGGEGRPQDDVIHC